jgi:uroporphyrinogen decarboxylase
MGMALDPEWIADMAMTYANFSLMHMDALFQAHGKPDGFFFFEDMGFKGKPFMSPEMYMQLVQPAHKHVFDWAHDQGLPVTVHSCGYIEPLVPGLVEAGMNCLQAMEVKAGMDLRTLAPRFGDRIAFYGNMDIREIATNDRDRIRAELEAKLPVALKQSRGYILASDHSIPPDVDYETLKWFFNTGRQMSREILGTD